MNLLYIQTHVKSFVCEPSVFITYESSYLVSASFRFRMPIFIHPFTLNFADSRLEREYKQKRYQEFLRPVEEWFVVADTSLFGIFFFSRLYKKECCTRVEGIFAAFAWMLHFSHLIFARFLGSERDGEYHYVSTALFKSVKVLFVSAGIFLWPMNTENKGLWYVMILRGGVFLNFGIGLGIPLMFKENTILQFLLTILSSFVRIKTTCDVILDEPFLLNRFLNFLKTTQRLFIILSEFDSSEIHSNKFSEKNIPNSCFHFLLVLYFNISFSLPTFILWHLEMKSRQAFILERRQREGRPDWIVETTWMPEMTIFWLGKLSKSNELIRFCSFGNGIACFLLDSGQ